MMHKESFDCISGLQFDQYVLGLLSPLDAENIQSHIADCDACQQRLAQRKADTQTLPTLPGFEALLAQGLALCGTTGEATPSIQPARSTPQQTPGEPVDGQDEGWSWWQMWSFGGMSLAACCAVIMAFLPQHNTLDRDWWREHTPQRSAPSQPRQSAPAAVQPGTNEPRQVAPNQRGGTAPGSGALPPARVGKAQVPVFGVVHFHKGTKYSQWTKPRERLQPGDLIQFAYQLPKATHVMICSINEQGEISTFFPLGGQRSAQLPPGTGTLPHNNSLELDDYLGQERLWIVASAKPISFNVLKRSIMSAFVNAKRELGKMSALRGPWHSQSLLIQKTPLHSRKVSSNTRRASAQGQQMPVRLRGQP